MIDPKITILNLITDDWSLGYTPRFSADWYDGSVDLPQVTVSHLATTPRFFAFSDDVTNSDRKIQAVYLVDVWSPGDAGKRWEMIQEIDRIIKAKADSPGGDIEFMEASSWVDLDEGQMKPPIFRSQLSVEMLYYG